MKRFIYTLMVLLLALQMTACQQQAALAAQDHSGPMIKNVETSVKTLAKSDCQNTSETVTADITDGAAIKQVQLWYRVGEDQKYTSVDMSLVDNKYTATVKALDTPGGEYGVWEFYITAEDQAGNKSQSPLDTSVQLLACVG